MLNKLLALGLALGLLSACGTSYESAVKQAAQQRWNALIAGQLDEAYRFYTDAFQTITPLDNFKKSIRGVGFWHKAEVQQVQCDSAEKRCEVDVVVTVAMKMRGLPEPMETSDLIHEVWVKQGWLSDWRYIKD